jgi:hypothetical protein
MIIEYDPMLLAHLSSFLDVFFECVKIRGKLVRSEETEFLLTLSEPFHILGYQIADFSPFFHAIKSKGRIKFRSVFTHSFPFFLFSASQSP